MQTACYGPFVLVSLAYPLFLEYDSFLFICDPLYCRIVCIGTLPYSCHLFLKMDQAVRFQRSIIKKYATKWMSFTAFKYDDNNEILSFRKIERLQNKIIKLKCHLQFNETYIINKMLPTYTHVNLHDDAARDEEFVLEFRLNLIKLQIEEISGNAQKNISPKLTSAKQDLKNTRRSTIRYAAVHCYLERLKQRTDEATKVTQQRNCCALYMEVTFS